MNLAVCTALCHSRLTWTTASRYVQINIGIDESLCSSVSSMSSELEIFGINAGDLPVMETDVVSKLHKLQKYVYVTQLIV